MDDFNVYSLSESRNEYSAMLVSRLTPQIITGVNSIFNEAVQLCQQNDEEEKYLMTFQNFLARVPKWNQDIVDIEKERIIKATNCVYLEDLLTCVHITQLKILTNMRVGNKQRKIDLDIPNLSSFIHKVYIAVSRKVYKNVFLYEQDILPLSRQKNMRELEQIVEACILNIIRDSMPLETILKSYLDESFEDEVEQIKEKVEEVIEPIKEIKPMAGGDISMNKVETESVKEDSLKTDETTGMNEANEVNTNTSDEISTPVESQLDSQVESEESNSNTFTIKKHGAEPSDIKPIVPESPIKQIETKENMQFDIDTKPKLNFSDNDNVLSYDKTGIPGQLSKQEETLISAPKTEERLEQISEQRWNERRMEDEEDDYDDEAPLKIMSDIKLDTLDIQNMNNNSISLNKQDLLGDIVELS